MAPEEKLLAEWFWTDRWMGSSAFLLPMEPRGLYRELLTQAWRRGGYLPKDPNALKRATGCSDEEWARCWPLIARYWELSDDGRCIFNATQLEVLAETRERYERQASAGRRAASARWERDAKADASAMRSHVRSDKRSQCPPSPSPSPSPSLDPVSEKKGATRPARVRGPTREEEILDRPVGLPPEAWARWIAHQWVRKKPTPTAVAQHRERFAVLVARRGVEAAVAFIDQCIGANAQGIPKWAYDQAMVGQITINGRRSEGVAEKLARELREKGIQLT